MIFLRKALDMMEDILIGSILLEMFVLILLAVIIIKLIAGGDDDV